MKPDHKDGLEEQLQQQFKDWEPMPASALFEQLQAKRKSQNKRRRLLWLWLFSSAAAIAIMATFFLRFEPNTDATQKMVMLENPNTLVIKPALDQPETKTNKRQSTIKTTEPKPLVTSKQTTLLKKTSRKKVNQLTIISSTTPTQVMVGSSNNKPNTLEAETPPSFKANTFEVSLIDTLKKDSNMTPICENVVIPEHLLTAEKNKTKTSERRQWFIAANYIQLFGEGVLSNNEKSMFQPTQSQANKQAEMAYATELIAGRRVYKDLYAWSGVQYRNLIYTQVKTFEQNYKENILSSQDMLSIFNQYFDLSYQIISLPIGVTWIEQNEKWQFNALLGLQAHYLLSTTSIQFLPTTQTIYRDINSASDERFKRAIFGAHAQIGAGRNVYKNFWLNLQVGNSWYQRSFLNPQYYQAVRARNLELKLGLQYYF
jgi:hypothetical protein